MADLIKSVRVVQQDNGSFNVDIYTAIPAERLQLINLPDTVERAMGLSFDDMVAQLRSVFPPIANP